MSSFRAFEGRGAFIALALLFKAILDYAYWHHISLIYSYSGFEWSPNLTKYIESWVLYLVLLALAPYRLKRPSDFFINILLFSLTVPLLSFYGLANQSRYFLYVFILGYALVSIFRIGRPFHIPILVEGPQVAKVLIFLCIIWVSVSFVILGGVSFFNLDFMKVYEYREAVTEKIGSGLMGYLNFWAYKVMGPMLLLIALSRKKYLLAILVFLLHMFWFGVSSHKAVLFYPFLVLLVWFCFRKKQALAVVPLGMALMVVLATIIYIVLDYGSISTLIVRRVFFIPARATFNYYEFFSTNPWIWWSNSSITFGLIDYPYYIDPAKLIGEWEGSGSSLNNSFLSTGYMHAGIGGIVLYGFLVGLLFRLVDSLAKALPMWFGIGTVVVPCYSLMTSADLPASLLTHGLGIGIVFLFFLRASHKQFMKDALYIG